jgi:hypothetical protein
MRFGPHGCFFLCIRFFADESSRRSRKGTVWEPEFSFAAQQEHSVPGQRV